MIVDNAEMEMLLVSPHGKILDSRSADRYRGENDNIDPIAGHIPGALSAPYQDDLTSHGMFRDRSQLRNRFQALLEGSPADNAVFYCGSGVTAAHNLLAMVYAGFDIGRLYVGSWSEWITDPKHPISTGSERG
jgi:thiosulfate/3-mercaptopyruvate sulfurtransferase